MYYIVETTKPFDQASNDLATAVKQHGFGVLHVHDPGPVNTNAIAATAASKTQDATHRARCT